MHSMFLVLLSALCVLQILALNPENTNVSVKCIQRERQALLSIKRGIHIKKDMLLSWGDGENQKECCNWEGVHCSNETGHVLKLHLHNSADNYAITDNSISPALGELHHLIYLDLSLIYFPSSIPGFIGSLTYLRYLILSNCGFQGNVPNELGNLLFLEYLDLQWNYLEGKIPSLLSNLSSLRYMDLNNNRFNGTLPPQLGNLLFLKYLDLSENNFTGTIPHHFGNLSNLQYFDLNQYESIFLNSDLQWVSNLSSLRHLSLPKINLSTANNWQHLVSGLSHLQYLDLGGCHLLYSISSSLSSPTNFSTSLSFVDISDNYLMSSSLIFPWLMNSTNSLSILRMNDNSLEGTIPESFGKLSSIEELNFANNMLKGPIPISFFHSCSLSELDLSKNRLTGQFHEFVQVYSRCPHKPLEILNLGWNEITGVVPDLSQLSSLQVLSLDGNRLNGTVHEGIGQLSNLTKISLRGNSLEGLIFEAHFSKLSQLDTLDLSHNALVFNVSTEWVPPFDLSNINLASCSLGPSFPRWLQTQRDIYILDISNNEISDIVPKWFWLLNINNLNLSHNHIRGKVENLPLEDQAIIEMIDLSSNIFEGPIPSFLSISEQVFLSDNIFSTVNLLLCSNSSKTIRFLDLSKNNLGGELLECWTNFKSLVVLDLSDNYFHGNIPRSMGSLRDIQSLHLVGNNFSGEIPLSFINCTKLQVFVVAQNNLTGLVPSWIGDNLPQLLVLSLHSNKFHGSIPLSICNLENLHVLDLSQNNLSGNIPKCIRNLSAMAAQSNSSAVISHYYKEVDEHVLSYENRSGVYIDSASLTWKGKMSKYGSTLGLLRSIDFSNNRLTGEIPSEITSLVGLVSLNISRNMLIGEIPSTIGQLKSLDFLDLSKNQLFGRIPSQLSQIAGLSVLDLSYNDLSGEIPLGTQLQARDASAYTGNPKLCGAPLNQTCPAHAHCHHVDENDAHVDDEFITEGFYIALGIGFIVGFWGVCCSLILKKSWRYAYFKFFNDIYDKMYVLAAIKMAKLQRIKS